MDWHIGCSGFHYKHWKGTFYPEGVPQTKWFDYYCQFFGTLELNVTFYRFPRLGPLQNWYRKSPANFKFAVKAPRAITHFKQFHDTANMLSDFYRTTREGLADKLGCVLFQMPPRLAWTEERLERIINSLDNSFLNVMEFRHASWWREDVYQALADRNISFCGMSLPGLPEDIVQHTPLLYYRFHGREQVYASRYSPEDLQSFVDSAQTGPAKEAYIFFNNDIHTHAIYNANEMVEMVKIRQL